MRTHGQIFQILFYAILAVAMKIVQVFIKVLKSILKTFIRKTREKIVPVRVDPHPTLRFHVIHGSNIELQKHSIVAHRIRGFNNGLVFSSTAIYPGEYVPIRVLEVVSKYNGRLVFGFTSIDPTTLRQRDLENFDKYSHADQEGSHRIWIDSLRVSQLRSSLSMRFHFNHSSVGICSCVR